MTGCNSEPSSPPYASSTQSDAGAGEDAAPTTDADASTEAGPPNDPLGGTLGALGAGAFSAEALQRLPFLRTDAFALREASFDRTGGNYDATVAGNFLYTDGDGNRVIFDEVGPGCVYRLWTTGFSASQRIRIWLDGDTAPRLDETLNDFYSAKKGPFAPPLVLDAIASSGGYVSRVPICFSSWMKISISAAPPDPYYDIDFHRYAEGTPIDVFTGKEDLADAKSAASKPGLLAFAGERRSRVETTADLPAGAEKTIFEGDGPGELVAIRAMIPGVFPVHQTPFTDSGRAHKGTSQFTLKIDPSNDGVVLQRRLDFGIPDQQAEVFVDDQKAGKWFDRGNDAIDHFRDHSFVVPAALTKGKSQIAIKVVFDAASPTDWNEFFYWAYSRVDGVDRLTDSLDVGDASSEAAHAYSNTNETFNGTPTFNYPNGYRFAAALNSLWVEIAWEGETVPSVSAPIGMLSAQGMIGTGYVNGLFAGMHQDGVMYLQFPMPFRRHAKVRLVNKGATPLSGVWSEVETTPFETSFDNVGIFHALFTTTTPSQAGADLVVVDTKGAGQIVGIVQTERGATNRGYLEGDDRFVIDGRRTPAIHGTGTEDIYSGGFYFDRGPFTQAFDGNPAHVVDGTDATTMYRFFYPDLIPFRDGVRFSIEHGPVNDFVVDAWTLAFYYAVPEARLVASDTLTIGDPTSEGAHKYAVTGETFSGTRTFTFEGERDTANLTASGRAHKGASEFSMSIDPKNRGVVLRRLSDQTIGRQRANVYVDGTKVATFYAPGRNATHAWREDEVILPESATRDKTAIAVKVEFVSSENDWNEFGYTALSIAQ